LPDDIPLPPPAPEEEPQLDENGDPIVNPIEEADGGFLIRDAALNDIFQMLAKRAGKQYFHNSKLAGPEYNVSGHLNGGDPLQQMEELAFKDGLTLYQKGNTVYALNQEQLNQLPSTEWHYQLAYLRPTDIEQIKQLIQPMLSPGTGIVNFEPKTNTIIVIDSAHHVEQARDLLMAIDQAKGQIVVEVKILSVNSSVAERTGVDWSSSLGATGIPLEAVQSLNSLFGIGSATAGAGATAGSVLAFEDDSSNSVVLAPFQINGVLRALAKGGLVRQLSNPTLITEDNELATISLIDRVPIITTTINQTESSNNITEEVRYQIDLKDEVGNPESTREIGVTLAVTPSLLPDGTIRMDMRPRSAQIVEEIIGQSGNKYPRVSESMIKTIARIPDGHSLLVGGFYGEVKQKDDNKVPLLGDIPFINFFFRSKEAAKETSSLVFVVTPRSYNPAVVSENCKVSQKLRTRLSMHNEHDWADDANPGVAHLPDLDRTLRGMNPRRTQYRAPVEDYQVDLETCDDSDTKAATSSAKGTIKRRRR
jgi:type II secretory pathway component GspD/PulD (secretin)